ncbi:MAG: hypothetical protein IJS59_04920 [Bacteroidaceae bacterium]|nr:hypothetical protein [Bacteroidaceae bacterium]
MEPADIMTTEAVAGGMQCVSAHDTRAVAAGVMAQKPSGPMPTTPVQKVEVERLPDLNTARSGHAVICVDGEVTVFGGHTTNFVPAATAEYYGDGGWHEMPMAYVHDNGFAVAHSSGRVLLGGGHEQYLGIGQTFVTEWYDPSEHSFQGFGGLAVKRVLATAVELDGGRVVVAGNHYHDDAVELFDGKGTFTKVKDVVAPHCSPHILRTSADNAIIFGCRDTYSHADSRPIVEPLQGQPYEEPLLCRWHPIGRESTINDECGFVGDAAAGDFTYIIPAVDSCGQLAILRVQGGSFSLLPTATPIPMQGLGGSIVYEHAIVADTCARRAYVHGYDSDGHHYLLRIDYADTLRGAAPLTLYYTDPLPWAGMQIPVVLPSGDLLVAGGYTGNNFEPSAAVYI